MKTEAITELGEMLGLNPISQGENVYLLCPVSPWTHGKGRMQTGSGSLSVLVTEGTSPYYCHACGTSGGDLTSLILNMDSKGFFVGSEGREKFFKAMSLIESASNLDPGSLTHDYDPYKVLKTPIPESFFGKPPCRVFEDSVLEASFKPIKNPSPALDYLHNRGLNDETILLYGLRYDSVKNMVVAPVRWADGSLIGAKGRSIDPSCPKNRAHYNYWHYDKKHVFFGENLVDFNKPLVVVEGEFDCMLLRQRGFNVVSVLGATDVKHKAPKLQDLSTHVYVLFDNDDPGRAESAKFARLLETLDVSHTQVFPPDCKDPSDVPVDTLRDLLKSEHPDRMSSDVEFNPYSILGVPIIGGMDEVC